MRRPGRSIFSRFGSVGTPAAAERPGRITALRGVIFQSDGTSWLGGIFIRPIEAFDRWQAGLAPGSGDAPSLAMHAGLHVEIEDGREFVAEQLVGTWFENFHDALNWTPLADFHARDHTGWDVTVPATAFRGIDAAVEQDVVDYLNRIPGKPFLAEDCTSFVERAFGGRRLFGDSPTALSLGVGLRVGDPALPLLRAEAPLDARTRHLLRFSAIQTQADPLADHTAPNARLWLGRAIVWTVLVGFAALTTRPLRRRHQ